MFHSKPNFSSQGAKLASHGGMLGVAESPALLIWPSGRGSREEKDFLEDWNIQERPCRPNKSKSNFITVTFTPNSRVR